MDSSVAIVSSDEAFASLLEGGLAQEGFRALVLSPAQEAVAEALAQGVEAIVLDVPSLGEADLAHFLRSLPRGREAVVILVSPEHLSTLDPSLDVDDFALRGAGTAEVAARLRIALWRRGARDSPRILRRGELVIDLAGYRVFVEGRPVQLTYKEYELLRFLASHPGRVFTREELVNKVWGYEFYGGTRTVDVHVRRLRAKIESPHRTFIETVRNVGYRFRPS
jgi:DNA-binding response OmpR family regulator